MACQVLPLNGFVSYLSNRCQSAKIRIDVSVPSTLKHGVLQGLVLSPILLPCIPHLWKSSLLLSLKYHFYAGHTQIYCHITLDDVKPTFSHLKKCVIEVQLWINLNKLKLNHSMIDFMVFGVAAMQKRLEPCSPTYILGVWFKAAELVQHPGVIFDCDL